MKISETSDVDSLIAMTAVAGSAKAQKLENTDAKKANFVAYHCTVAEYFPARAALFFK